MLLIKPWCIVYQNGQIMFVFCQTTPLHIFSFHWLHLVIEYMLIVCIVYFGDARYERGRSWRGGLWRRIWGGPGTSQPRQAIFELWMMWCWMSFVDIPKHLVSLYVVISLCDLCMVVIGIVPCGGFSSWFTHGRGAWCHGHAISLSLHKCSTRAFTIHNYSIAPHPYLVK